MGNIYFDIKRKPLQYLTAQLGAKVGYSVYTQQDHSLEVMQRCALHIAYLGIDTQCRGQKMNNFAAYNRARDFF